MTPKEKAEKLVGIYWDNVTADTDGSWERAKQCALIAVDEILNSNPHSNPFNTEVYSTMQYWQEVKQEIEKL